MPASERPQSTEAGRPQGMLGHPQHPPTEHARQARCSQCGASASPTATHPTTTGPSCPCVTGGGAEVPGVLEPLNVAVYYSKGSSLSRD